jgi:2-amino-4-hydroxy-6-hydroxymethyldihydropteridine diphosphokinase
MKKIILGLGSNQGNRIQNLESAILQLHLSKIYPVFVSSIFCSLPEGYLSENEYLNAAILCETQFTAKEVLEIVKTIEAQHGRIVSKELSDRPLDIDILFFEDLTIHTTQLQIPHPRIWERAFVMEPIKQVFELEECRNTFSIYEERIKKTKLSQTLSVYNQTLKLPI